MSVLLALAAATAPLTVSCNTVNALGLVTPYQMEVDHERGTLGLQNLATGAQISTSDVVISPEGVVRFSAVIDGRKLQLRLSHGFGGRNSALDAKIVNSTADEFGLPHLVGVCGDEQRFVHAEQANSPSVTPLSPGVHRPACTAVLLNGDVFAFYFSNRNGEPLAISTVGKRGSDFQNVRVKETQIPSIPREDVVMENWHGYEAIGPAGATDFIMRFIATESINAVVLDFQTIDGSPALTTVGRAHCGFHRQQET